MGALSTLYVCTLSFTQMDLITIQKTSPHPSSIIKEQRRKRTRENAAASCQHQRDCITELEQEVSAWKNKYEETLARIEKLERLSESGAGDFNVDPVCSSTDYIESAAISPCSCSINIHY